MLEFLQLSFWAVLCNFRDAVWTDSIFAFHFIAGEIFFRICDLFAVLCQVTSVVSDSLRLHGLQPTRLLCPWDFPSKSTGVGCHCKYCLLVGLLVFWLVMINHSATSLIHTLSYYSLQMNLPPSPKAPSTGEAPSFFREPLVVPAGHTQF